MIGRLGAAMLVILAGASPAIAGPGTCLAIANDTERGHSVLVRLHVGEAGTIESREAEWILAAPGSDLSRGLSLKLGYVAQVSEGLGPVTSVTLNYSSQNGSGLPARATGSLEYASGRRWTAPFQGFMGLGLAQLSVKTPWGGRLNPELTESIESASRVTVAIRGPNGSALQSVVLDPSDLASRDRLLSEASAEAEQRAAAPQSCS